MIMLLCIDVDFDSILVIRNCLMAYRPAGKWGFDVSARPCVEFSHWPYMTYRYETVFAIPYSYTCVHGMQETDR